MYKIRLAKNDQEIIDAKRLVKDFFKRNYKTYPVEVPDYFIVAENLDTKEIVATIGLDCKMPNENKTLEVERYFELSLDQIIPDAKKQGIGEIGRWVSTDNKVTIYVLLGAFLLAKRLKINYIVTFQKEKVAILATKRYKLPLDLLKYNVRSYMKEGAYREYFIQNDLVVFTQKTDVLIKSIEKNYGYPPYIDFEFPHRVKEIQKFKTVNYGPAIFSE